MSDIEKKLNEFTDSIMKEADNGTKEIMKKIEQERKRDLDEAALEIEREMSNMIKTKSEGIRGRESRRISAAMMEHRRGLFELRGEFADDVFELVRQKLSDFTRTYDYLDQMKKLLNQALDVLGRDSAVTVSLRYDDLPLADELKKASGGGDLTFQEGHFELGGLLASCPDKDMAIDMTFDAALDDLVGHFAELFGLEIE
jgi:vacuolar-type H+-ATPase subunit E/Vma4